MDNVSSAIKAGSNLNIYAQKVNNEAHSIEAPAAYGGGKLYASLSAGSLISGGNVSISGMNAGTNALEINNIISEIKAVDKLKLAGEKINNLAVGNINFDAERGISTTRNTYSPKVSYNGSYGKAWDESARITHTATQGKLSGDEVEISGGIY